MVSFAPEISLDRLGSNSYSRASTLSPMAELETGGCLFA
jgi:hypothetical protein